MKGSPLGRWRLWKYKPENVLQHGISLAGDIAVGEKIHTLGIQWREDKLREARCGDANSSSRPSQPEGLESDMCPSPSKDLILEARWCRPFS